MIMKYHFCKTAYLFHQLIPSSEYTSVLRSMQKMGNILFYSVLVTYVTFT